MHLFAQMQKKCFNVTVSNCADFCCGVFVIYIIDFFF